MGNRANSFDPNKIAKELKLTELQQKFCDYYLFITGLDAEKAVELAGYKFNYDKEKYKDEALIEHYKLMQIKRQARELLNNPEILEYITSIRENLDKELIVDKLWVIKKLKTLAENGAERTQLEATKLLGQTMSMFTEVQRTETAEDPATLARKAFEERMRGNVVEFKKDGTDGD